jgi:ABC-2 type transport system permease protein
MVWIALALLALTMVIVGLNTAAGGWNLAHRRPYGRMKPTFQELMVSSDAAWRALPYPTPATSVAMAVDAATVAILQHSDFMRFTRGFVFLLFFSFLVPIWSLSFATEALGGERESHGMIWLLTRPLSRPAIYLGKFVAVLPWCLALNVGGYALICVAAGQPGREAFLLFWPAVFWSSLTFCALFFLFGAFFRRPAIVGLVYSFFLEVIIGNMPGTLKRLSIGFYARCMMFDAAEEKGLAPENPVLYDPVSGKTALVVLVLSTVVLVGIGMLWFRKAEYVSGD